MRVGLLLAGVVGAISIIAGDWPAFRGPYGRDGPAHGGFVEHTDHHQA